MVMVPSAPTVAWACTLVHHRSIDVAPLSSISIIGIRLVPCIGAASSTSSLPNGNASVAEAGTANATARAEPTSQADIRIEIASLTAPANEMGPPRRPHHAL